MDGWMDGWIDGRLERSICSDTLIFPMIDLFPLFSSALVLFSVSIVISNSLRSVSYFFFSRAISALYFASISMIVLCSSSIALWLLFLYMYNSVSCNVPSMSCAFNAKSASNAICSQYKVLSMLCTFNAINNILSEFYVDKMLCALKLMCNSAFVVVSIKCFAHYLLHRLVMELFSIVLELH